MRRVPVQLTAAVALLSLVGGCVGKVDPEKISPLLKHHESVWILAVASIIVLVLLLAILWSWRRSKSPKNPGSRMSSERRTSPPPYDPPLDLDVPISPFPDTEFSDDRPAISTLATSPFVLEALVSSGPRKSHEDYEAERHELCEDSAGVIQYAAGEELHQIWWLCDGTSQNPLLSVAGHPDMSTRMLARDIGDIFSKAIIKTGGEVLPNFWGLFAEVVKIRWRERFGNHLRNLEDNGRLEAFLDSCPTDADGCVLKWSSTFLGGIVKQHPGKPRKAKILHVGDSGAVVRYEDSSGDRSEVLAPRNDRIILQIKIPRDAPHGFAVRMIALSPDNKVQTFDNLKGFVALSDGVIKTDFKQFLTSLAEKSRLQPDFQDIRHGLAGRTDRSYDDKSMVIGWVAGD